MHAPMAGPFWGNLAIIVLCGLITIACFALMIRMLVRPGEADRRHPKYSVLKEKIVDPEVDRGDAKRSPISR